MLTAFTFNPHWVDLRAPIHSPQPLLENIRQYHPPVNHSDSQRLRSCILEFASFFATSPKILVAAKEKFSKTRHRESHLEPTANIYSQRFITSTSFIPCDSSKITRSVTANKEMEQSCKPTGNRYRFNTGLCHNKE
jgi:hypothetical protein